ncbi:glycosyltransferase [Gaetbulibacter aestuarii]|uniref:Glycosyltransferase n=1 Tax=Gaetbulibacter aestuarii TaxID=1502358 RepID=A0ABW7N1M7_9FLAO
MDLQLSFIIPVYNRPQEVEELLESFTKLETQSKFEVVIVEDGSTISSENVVKTYKSRLHISYYYKPNSGPGDSRNYGMSKAHGNYFIILDSDCVLPSDYLHQAETALKKEYVDCFGGPDAAHEGFSKLQKAINFSMTSLLTTGGIRGGKKGVGKFQPRSFNMGISKKAFEATGGFGKIHPGEDPDLSIRLWNKGFETTLFPKAKVYHKRRISWKKFYTQVYKFGQVRAILNQWHPETKSLTYWFPGLFSVGFMIAIILLFFGINELFLLYVIYFILAFLTALWNTKSLTVAFMSLMALSIQFFGYGYGFLKSTYYIQLLKKEPQTQFPKLFFN